MCASVPFTVRYCIEKCTHVLIEKSKEEKTTTATRNYCVFDAIMKTNIE